MIVEFRTYRLKPGSVPQAEERFGQALPGAARNVVAPKLSGELVEIGPHLVLPAAKSEAKGFEVLLGLGDFGRGLAQNIEQLRESVGLGTLLQSI